MAWKLGYTLAEIERNREDRFPKRVCVIRSRLPFEGPQVVCPRIDSPVTLAHKYIAADHSQGPRYGGNRSGAGSAYEN